MVHTLKALSVLDVTDEMKNEMEISTEFWRKDSKTRGSKMDVLVKFPSKRIHIEIQRVINKDEIPRSSFYMGKLLTDIPEGKRIVSPYDVTSIWICDFNPFEERMPDLPYYHFLSTYKRHDGIYGCDGCYELGNGISYLFVNCRFDWGRLDELTKEEEMLKDFMHDMKQSDVNNILHDEVSRVLSRYKEGGTMYDKYLIELREMHLESFDRFEEHAREEGIKEGRSKGIQEGILQGLKDGRSQGILLGEKKKALEIAKNMLDKNMDPSVIESVTHLTKEQILSL